MLYEVTQSHTMENVLVLRGTPDEVLTETSTPLDAVDVVAGYLVKRASSGQHDGHRGTTFALADSMGEREIGRLTVRNDASREEVLTWERHFYANGDAARFLARWQDRDSVPDGFVQCKARQLDDGDRVWVNGREHVIEVGVSPASQSINAGGVPDDPELKEMFPSGIAVHVMSPEYDDEVDAEETFWVKR